MSEQRETVHRRAFDRERAARLAAEEQLKLRTHELYAAIQAMDEERAKWATREASFQIAQLATEQAQIEAAASASAKSEFLANMSRELRAPLTSILGFAETLVDSVDRPEQRDAAETIRRNGEHLLRIIHDIVDLSRLESNHMTVESIEVASHDLINDVESIIREHACDRGINFEVNIDGKIPGTVYTDPLRLRQILTTTLDNAIRFTNDGGVRLDVSYTNENLMPLLVFDITDTGAGMDQDQVTDLFQPFVRVGGDDESELQGTGLGMALAKRFAELLGGSMAVTCSAPDAGTAIRITVSGDSPDDVEMLDESCLCGPEIGTVSPTPNLPRLSNANILVAEDGPDDRRLISFILGKAGANVTVKGDGQLALETALKARNDGCPFDCILLDMQMPVMSGYEVARGLRAANYDGIVIALTGNLGEEDRGRCIDAGCDDYAAKPIQRAELINLIDSYIRQHTEAA